MSLPPQEWIDAAKAAADALDEKFVQDGLDRALQIKSEIADKEDQLRKLEASAKRRAVEMTLEDSKDDKFLDTPIFMSQETRDFLDMLVRGEHLNENFLKGCD